MKLTNVFAQLVEALKPSQYRPFVKNWDRNRYVELFDQPKYKTDKKKFRLYIPLEPEKENVKPIPEVEAAVKAAGYTIADYIAGMASDERGRLMKIGKILARSAPDLAQKFANDPQREASKAPEHLVVISRHPYDVAGMSTDRGWRSCMNLKDGVNKHYVPLDVKEGTLVAYVVKNDDKNINRPVGRILIKPFVNEANHNQIALGSETRVYGTDVPGFRKLVGDWCDAVNEKRELQGIFQLHPRLYNDGGGMKKRMIGKDFSIEDKIRFNPKEIEGVRNPSEELQLLAVEQDPYAIQYIKTPARKVVLKVMEKGSHFLDHMKRQGIEIPHDLINEAFERNPEYIRFFDQPSLAMCKDAYTRAQNQGRAWNILSNIKQSDPPKEFWAWCLERDPEAIGYVEGKDADELHELYIHHHININKDSWRHAWRIKKPSKKIIDKLIEVCGHGVLGSLEYYGGNAKITKAQGDAAVKAHPEALSRIPSKWVSKDVQEAAVMKNPRMINMVSKDVKLAVVKKNPRVIAHIQTGNDMTGKMSQIAYEMCMIALPLDPAVIHNIDMPTEEMVMIAVNHDPLLMFGAKTKYWPIKAMAMVLHKHPNKKKDIEDALKKSRMHGRKWEAVQAALAKLESEKKAAPTSDVHLNQQLEAINHVRVGTGITFNGTVRKKFGKIVNIPPEWPEEGYITIDYENYADPDRYAMKDFREAVTSGRIKIGKL